MAIKRYAVVLSEAERAQLRGLIATGTDAAARLQHARVLLKADQGPHGSAWTDERITEAVDVSQPNASRIREQYVEDGLQP
jgi:hypothetical protein